MVDSGYVIEQAEALLRRVSPEGRRVARRARERRRKAAMKIVRRLLLSAILIAIAAVGWGLVIGPIGIGGFMLAMLVTALAWMSILYFSKAPEYTPEALVQSDLRLLPQRTEEWLVRQRPALPAPAQRLVDGIGLRLEGIAPQLAALDPREPAAFEVRKLIGEELPELVGGYQRVPEALRREGRNGLSPDKQLLEGLKTVDEELVRMTEQLASGDLDKLATQNRYLELKYRGEEGLNE